MYGLWDYLLKAKVLAPINARRVLVIEGGYLKKTNAFQVYAIGLIEIAHYELCFYKSTGQTENGLEHVFVKHRLKSVEISGP